MTTIRAIRRNTTWILAAHAMGIALFALSSGCASTGYMGNRLHDAADVFSGGVGVGAGGKVRAGPLQTGLLFDLPKAGLRGGKLAVYGKHDEFFASNHDIQFICYGVEGFWTEPNDRKKNFEAGADMSNGFGSPALPFWHHLHKQNRNNYAYYTQLELVLAVGGSIRLGFNPGELMDFLLGWTTIDIYADDLKRTSEPSNASYKVAAGYH